MTTKREDYDSEFVVERPSGWGTTETVDNDEVWINQLVSTPYGFVDTHSTSAYGGQTSLRFIYEGRMYLRYIYRFHRPRYLVTLAMRFAQEIVD